MAKFLPGRSIYNFSFVGCSLERPYLLHAARLLNPKSPNRSLVIGISPHCFMPRTKVNLNQGYLHWSAQRPASRQALLAEIRRDNWTGLAQARFFVKNLLCLVKRQPLGCYFLDGWEASVPLRKQKEGYVQWMQKVYQKQPVDLAILDGLFHMIGELQQAGITVYGFRSPGDKEMRRVENQKSGVDFDEVPGRFQTSGGVWLKVDETSFPTYDGVHMGWRSAIRFSRHLAEVLFETEQRLMANHERPHRLVQTV
ncbi:MAG: hypothetical protein KQI62_05475 [Deltaproteobacteria bacterium]|nr:hypothetical protein [Deltaproteobacteria bacterium]